MEAEEFDESAFFDALAAAGVRYMLIGRRAIAALGAPILTADYDLWVHVDDAAKLNGTASAFELFPTHTPDEARARGRYVLEGPEHVDVLLTRSRSTPEGVSLSFDDALARSVSVGARGPRIPCLADLVTTKRWASRPKDALDIQFLERLLARGSA
jgi:hypothetical protein